MLTQPGSLLYTISCDFVRKKSQIWVDSIVGKAF